MVIDDNYTDHGDHLIMYVIVKYLCCLSETNILFISIFLISLKNFKLKQKKSI